MSSFIMAAVAPKIFLILQMLGALVLIITGILDRVDANDRPGYMFFPLSYIVMPAWTGVLIEITVVCGLVVKTKMHVARNSALVLVYKSLNITCCILCGFLLFRYGEEAVLVYTADFALKQSGDGLYYFSDDMDDDKNLNHLTTISVMALIELFLSIVGAVAFQDRSPYTQAGFQT
ncbi:hypothetical protein ACROYT_G030747 [Oculina patagonica]